MRRDTVLLDVVNPISSAKHVRLRFGGVVARTASSDLKKADLNEAGSHTYHDQGVVLCMTRVSFFARPGCHTCHDQGVILAMTRVSYFA